VPCPVVSNRSPSRLCRSPCTLQNDNVVPCVARPGEVRNFGIVLTRATDVHVFCSDTPASDATFHISFVPHRAADPPGDTVSVTYQGDEIDTFSLVVNPNVGVWSGVSTNHWPNNPLTVDLQVTIDFAVRDADGNDVPCEVTTVSQLLKMSMDGATAVSVTCAPVGNDPYNYRVVFTPTIAGPSIPLEVHYVSVASDSVHPQNNVLGSPRAYRIEPADIADSTTTARVPKHVRVNEMATVWVTARDQHGNVVDCASRGQQNLFTLGDGSWFGAVTVACEGILYRIDFTPLHGPATNAYDRGTRDIDVKYDGSLIRDGTSTLTVDCPLLGRVSVYWGYDRPERAVLCGDSYFHLLHSLVFPSPSPPLFVSFACCSGARDLHRDDNRRLAACSDGGDASHFHREGARQSGQPHLVPRAALRAP